MLSMGLRLGRFVQSRSLHLLKEKVTIYENLVSNVFSLSLKAPHQHHIILPGVFSYQNTCAVLYDFHSFGKHFLAL